MKIYTKTGDKGMTSLWGGKKVAKDDIRIEAYGTVDELNCQLGLIKDLYPPTDQTALLLDIQSELFSIGSVLATAPGSSSRVLAPSDEFIIRIEDAIDLLTASLLPLTNFILPGGHPTVSQCHIARTVCRRAERRVVALSKGEQVPENVIVFLNRLSDYLFVLARTASKILDIEEVKWGPNT